MNSRYDRNIRFFGEKGQEKLRGTKATLVGVGGVGGHLAQQLALLGLESIGLIDAEELDDTNRNRYVTARAADQVPGTPKVDIGERLIKEVDPSINVIKVQDSLISDAGFRAILQSDYVFGCVDSEGARLVLTELCAAYRLPYFDIASDIEVGAVSRYGGRVCAARGEGCLVCLRQLDMAEAQRELEGPEARKAREAIYGIDKEHLGRTGPSVVSINGVVASLAVTEFIVGATGIRRSNRLMTYRAEMGKVFVSGDEPEPDCFYCKGVWGQRGRADTERYIRGGVGAFLR